MKGESIHNHGIFRPGYKVTKLDAAYLKAFGAPRVLSRMEIRGKTRELVRNFSSTDVLTKPSYQDNQVKERGWLSTVWFG
jgi:hypothetical protein